MSLWRQPAKNQAAVDSPIARKIMSLNETAMTEAAKSQDPKDSLSMLEQAEEMLVKEAQRSGTIDPKYTGLYLVTWNNMCIIHKKMMDYMACLKRLMTIQQAELAVGSTRLELATTKLNLGTCCHFLERSADGLVHSNAAIEVLLEEVERTQQDQRIDQAYKKKLFLNLVLGYFNRAVQFQATGQEAQCRVNINQSLELATQKFGKDQPIYQMITANASKAPGEMKPFFVSKNPDLKEIYTQSYLLKLSPSDFGVQVVGSSNPKGMLASATSNHNLSASQGALENSALHSNSGRSSQGRQTGTFPMKSDDNRQGSRSIDGNHGSSDNFTLNPKATRTQDSFGEAKVPVKIKSLNQGSSSIPFQKYSKLTGGERNTTPISRSTSEDHKIVKNAPASSLVGQRSVLAKPNEAPPRIAGGLNDKWNLRSAQTGLDSPMETVADRADSDEQTFREESWQGNRQDSQSKSSNLSTQVTTSFLVRGTPRSNPITTVEVFDGFFVGKMPPPKKTYSSVGIDAPPHKHQEEQIPYGSWVRQGKPSQTIIGPGNLSNPAIKSLLRHMK